MFGRSKHLALPAALLATVIWALAAEVKTAQAQSELSCQSVLDNAGDLNAFALFAGAETCGGDARPEDVTFLILTGQARYTADSAVLFPAGEPDKERIGELYYQVFYTFGGLGPTPVLSDIAAVNRVEQRLLANTIVFDAAYDPGWSYSEKAPTHFYDVVAENEMRRRLWTLKNFATLLQDDAYREAGASAQSLQAKVGAFEFGSPELAEFNRLKNVMRARSEAIALPPPPADTTPYKQLNKASLEAMLAAAKAEGNGFRQIYSGLKGPIDNVHELYFDAQSVRQSWIAETMPASELNDLLDDIDFEKQVLVGDSFGFIDNASGSIYVTAFRYDNNSQGYQYSMRLGIRNEDCPGGTNERENSRPFVLAVTNIGVLPDGKMDRQKNFVSSSHSHYSDDCS